ncbi:MAG TPA: tetratricopeptide repeat protein [Hyphomicrobiaceae bacterium]|jgi:predicted O-linked N-acetylglucosamine transferase (SPINDLY family)|nr:tetratricopeptide repeat protein [Hyphomicrobiaceae bacterium]
MAGSQRSVLELLQQAGQAREMGAFDRASKLCRLVLKSHPRQTDALHLLAVLALERNNFAEADQRFRAVLALKPNSQQALFNHSLVLCELGRAEEALAQCERAVLLGGDATRGHALRAAALRALKRGPEALTSYDQAIAGAPRDPELHFNRGNLLRELERFEEAMASYDATLAIAPHHLGAINNRGTALRDLGRYEEALKSYDGAISIDPKSWQAYNNKGNLLQAMGHLDEAVNVFAAAISRAPRNPECHYNLGNAEHDRGRYSEAMACYSNALAIDPRYVAALTNRAGAARRLKLYKKALADYAAAKREDPHLPYLDGYIAHTQAQACDWSRLEQEKVLLERVRRGERACEPFSLLSLSDNESDHRACAESWVADKFSHGGEVPRQASKSDERIRLAYLSPDFRNHATSYLMARLIELHDRRQFHIVGMSIGPKANDAMRQRVSQAFDKFIDVSGLSDRAAAETLHAEGIDIAVDLAGYTEHARAGILANRPAPLQVSYLGYPGTTGAPFIDYLIADRCVIPEAARSAYSERIIYLPDTYQVNDHKIEMTTPVPPRQEVGLPADGFVFCCFNNSYKIRPQIFDVWMRLLRRIDGSVLWLLRDSEECCENLRRQAAKRGVAPERLIFAPRVGNDQHLARHKLAGLFLDTLPYNAHTTASDALRAGVPLITCAGSSFAGRVAASLLKAVGLPELVTQSLEDYEAMAAKLAQSPAELQRLRTTLAANAATHALFDTDRFRRNIEAAYVEMHRRQQAGEAPADFTVG